jgi:hypothetical protein
VLPNVPGPRCVDRPVSVLTSERTFSGLEDVPPPIEDGAREALGRLPAAQ